MLIFEDDGTLQARYDLDTDGLTKGLEIPPGQFHALLADSKPATFLEIKPGPYQPLAENEVAPWSPEEEHPEAEEFISQLTQLSVGDRVNW